MTNSKIYSPELTKRIFASGAIGNILETYDLILISLMATTLSGAFFPPAATPYTHVINVMYVFLIGLLVRPIGNIIMGILADQYGRKKLMIVSLIFTGIGTISIGILPTYAYIGAWSTTLFVILRIFQNFFAGIEYINSATYLVESSNKNTSGYYASWTAIGVSGGYLLASVMALTVSSLIAEKYIPDWGWRIVFLFSIFGVIFGFWIRKSIPESLTFILNNSTRERKRKRDILITSFHYIIENPLQCLSISAITLLGICLTYIYYIYIPINLITYRHFTQLQVYGLNAGSLSIVVLLIPFFGKISDYLNRITLLKVISGIVLILALPFFWLCSYGTFTEIILITALISIPAACFFSIYPAIITGSFPSEIRCTTASLIYQIIVSVEMGILPLFATYLIKVTDIPYFPGYILIAATLIGLIGLLYLEKQKNDNGKLADADTYTTENVLSQKT
jgi:MHS family proline/betaine transporter-like MFS transporter